MAGLSSALRGPNTFWRSDAALPETAVGDQVVDLLARRDAVRLGRADLAQTRSGAPSWACSLALRAAPIRSAAASHAKRVSTPCPAAIASAFLAKVTSRSRSGTVPLGVVGGDAVVVDGRVAPPRPVRVERFERRVRQRARRTCRPSASCRSRSRRGRPCPRAARASLSPPQPASIAATNGTASSRS